MTSSQTDSNRLMQEAFDTYRFLQRIDPKNKLFRYMFFSEEMNELSTGGFGWYMLVKYHVPECRDEKDFSVLWDEKNIQKGLDNYCTALAREIVRIKRRNSRNKHWNYEIPPR